MAASALVAVPEPAGSRAPSSARSIDAAAFAAVSIPLPAGSSATTIPETTMASGAAEGLGPDSVFAVSGAAVAQASAPQTPTGRDPVDQPTLTAHVVTKNYWRFDPNISWYGPGFYGSGTACGQKYSKTIMGVAHRTLPCGTLVTFRNPANGRQITVPVIDRGPYVRGRTWDMSRGLCAYLDHCYTGSIQWRYGS
jgi:hypothetical protein